jgi:response regulator RpfG family c-di-GMP phosphodiesterase
MQKMTPTTVQMESLGFGDCLDERIFFAAPPRSRDPVQLARVEARKAAATLLRSSVVRSRAVEQSCERMASWSRRLARELGLSSEDVLDIELGALLHDIGCAGGSHVASGDAVSPTGDEWLELRRHPAAGVALLGEIPALRRAIPLVVAHHERFDGKGYPCGMRGDAIPIDARVFHLVDAYEALTAGGARRAKRSDAVARTKIESGVGSRFDPLVYSAFRAIDPAEWIAIGASV